MFDGCRSLKYVDVRNDAVFQQLHLNNVVSLSIGGDVTSIGEGQFRGLSDLTTLILHDGIVSIDNYAFEDSKNLSLVRIPDSLASVGYRSFNIAGDCQVVGPQGVMERYCSGELKYGHLVTYTFFDNPVGADYISYGFAMTGELIDTNPEDYIGSSASVMVLGADYSMEKMGYIATTNDVEVQVRYHDQFHTVQFVYEDEVLAEFTIHEGETVPEPPSVPVKDGDANHTYDFIGWSGYEEGMQILEDSRFEAVFIPVLVNVNGLMSEDDFVVDRIDEIGFPMAVDSEVFGGLRSAGLSGLKLMYEGIAFTLDLSSASSLGDEGVIIDFSILDRDDVDQSVADSVDSWRFYEMSVLPEYVPVVVTMPCDPISGSQTVVWKILQDGSLIQEGSSGNNGDSVSFTMNGSMTFTTELVNAPPSTFDISLTVVILVVLIAVMLIVGRRMK